MHAFLCTFFYCSSESTFQHSHTQHGLHFRGRQVPVPSRREEHAQQNGRIQLSLWTTRKTIKGEWPLESDNTAPTFLCASDSKSKRENRADKKVNNTGTKKMLSWNTLRHLKWVRQQNRCRYHKTMLWIPKSPNMHFFCMVLYLLCSLGNRAGDPWNENCKDSVAAVAQKLHALEDHQQHCICWKEGRMTKGAQKIGDHREKKKKKKRKCKFHIRKKMKHSTALFRFLQVQVGPMHKRWRAGCNKCQRPEKRS